jgi:amino acid transporter
VAEHAAWLPLALAAWALVWLLASRDVRTAARSLLAFEVGSVALIVVLMAIVVAKLGGGDGPRGHGLSADWLQLPSGTTLGTLALASTFGFLSFAGFESAGSLGEESRRPQRMVPRAMALAIVVGGAFYVACTAVQSLGFGTDALGVRAFAGSEAPLGDLAQRYVGSGMADALDVAAIVSALGAGLGCASVSARMLFALGRDRRLPGRLAAVSPGTGAPVAGLAFVMCLDLVLLLVLAAIGKEAMDVFFYLATIGILSLLAMYLMTNLAALRFLRARGARAELLLPAAGVAVAGYVLYHNVWPVPAAPFDVFPYLVGAWLVVGVAASIRSAAPRSTDAAEAQLGRDAREA